MISAIVLAGGKGTRMGGDTKKQYMNVYGKPVIAWSLEAFQNSIVEEIILVCSSEDMDYCRREIIDKYGISKCTKLAEGGSERYLSVNHGLAKCSGDYVMIHDGARLCVSTETINCAAKMLLEKGACCVGTKATDTMDILNEDGSVAGQPERRLMWVAQTPQCFKTQDIKEGYEKALKAGEIKITDDVYVAMKYANVKVFTLDDGADNIKLTTWKDLILAESILERKSEL